MGIKYIILRFPPCNWRVTLLKCSDRLGSRSRQHFNLRREWVCWKKSIPPWCDMKETFLQWSSFLSVSPISCGLQPSVFAQSDWLFGKQLFYENKNEEHSIIYLDTIFYYANPSPTSFCDSTYPSFIKLLLLVDVFFPMTL